MSDLHKIIKDKWDDLAAHLDVMIEEDADRGELNKSQDVINHLHAAINNKHQAIVCIEFNQENEHANQD